MQDRNISLSLLRDAEIGKSFDPTDLPKFRTAVFAFIVVKFIYSEKAAKFCEVSTVDLSNVVPVKSMVEISQNIVVFSEYMNFTKR